MPLDFAKKQLQCQENLKKNILLLEFFEKILESFSQLEFFGKLSEQLLKKFSKIWNMDTVLWTSKIIGKILNNVKVETHPSSEVNASYSFVLFTLSA